MNVLKTIAAGLVLLLACADVPAGQEIDSVEQDSCLAPCRKVPHKIFLNADLIPGWGPSGGTDLINSGVYASGIGYGRMTYNINTLRVQWYQAFNNCVAGGAGGVCDGQTITCPAASQIVASESSFKLYCGDLYNGGPSATCGATVNGVTYANYNWFAPGSAPIDHLWKLAPPYKLLSDYFQSATVVPAGNPGQKTIACNYHVQNGFFWLDMQ